MPGRFTGIAWEIGRRGGSRRTFTAKSSNPLRRPRIWRQRGFTKIQMLDRFRIGRQRTKVASKPGSLFPPPDLYSWTARREFAKLSNRRVREIENS